MDTAPAFFYRMLLDFPLMSVGQSIAIVDWIAKNRMNWFTPVRTRSASRRNGTSVAIGGAGDPQARPPGDLRRHTMHTWLSPEHFQAHPTGSRSTTEAESPTLCVTNGDMTAELIRNLQRFSTAVRKWRSWICASR